MKIEEEEEKNEDVVMKNVEAEDKVKQILLSLKNDVSINQKIEEEKMKEIKDNQKMKIEVEEKKKIEEEKLISTTPPPPSSFLFGEKNENNSLKATTTTTMATPNTSQLPIFAAETSLSTQPIVLKTPPQPSSINAVNDVWNTENKEDAFTTTDKTTISDSAAADSISHSTVEEAVSDDLDLPSPIKEKTILLDPKIRPTKDVLETWNCQEVSQFLINLHLNQYCTIFIENVIDGAVLISLDNEQCEALGVKVFHRPKLLRSIKQIANEDSLHYPFE